MSPLVSLLEAVRYCERGAAPAFWAEPVNALTNAGYLAAALCGLALVRAAALTRVDRRNLLALIGLAACVGVGSTAFHTAPSSATKLADIVPIAVFVAGAIAMALRRLIGLPIAHVAGYLAVIGVGAGAVTSAAKGFGCDNGSCLNGAPAYVPVLAAMLAIAIAAHRKTSGAAPSLYLASLAFGVSLAARTIDLAVCPLLAVGPIILTAHALWHIGTALTVYLVLRGLTHGLRLTS